MLRITTIADNGMESLRLEGKLVGPWVAEFEQACEAAQIRSSRVYLDLALVTFVDTAGASSLRALVSQGVVLAACSGFVTELLQDREL